MTAFLDGVRKLPLDTLSDEDAKAELERLRSQLAQDANAYVREILAEL